MEKIIAYVNHELNLIASEKHKLKTGDVRKLSSKVYKKIENESFKSKLDICESLLDEREWAMGIIAYDIAYRERAHYTLETFNRFEKWLIDYVRGWGDCDDFCTHAFGALLAKYNILFNRIIQWCDRPEFWIRRAAAVITIYPMRKGLAEEIDPFIISDALMNDKNHLVLKGYGWMLKIYGQINKKKLENYLIKNVNTMPRVSFRYALEKLDEETRNKLMRI